VPLLASGVWVRRYTPTMDKLYSVKTLRENVRIVARYTRPLFRWSEAATSWVEGLYASLGNDLRIQTTDFEVVTASNFGAHSIIYRVFGGASRILFFPDRLEFDFPTVLQSDSDLIRKIVHGIFLNLPSIQSTSIKEISAESSAHLDCIGFSRSDYLSRFAIASVAQVLTKNGVAFEPAAKYIFHSQVQELGASVTVERSTTYPNALYLAISVFLPVRTAELDFDTKFEAVRSAYNLAATALNLSIDQSTT